MANALTERNYNVTIICSEEKRGRPGFPLNDGVNFINIFDKFSTKSTKLTIYEKIKCFSFKKINGKQYRYEARSQKLCDLLNTILNNISKIDLFISFTPESSYLLSKIYKNHILRPPVITMYHFCPEKFIGDWNYENFYKNAVSDSDIVQVLMPEYIQIAQHLHPTTKILCIPNVAPFQENDLLPILTSKKIINIARIAEQKKTRVTYQSLCYR